MGLRFRRSVKICKGLRINFNKNSWGMSVGGRGYGYSFNSKGRQTKHIGIPGTGISYTTSTSPKKTYNKSTSRTVETTIRLHMDDEGKMTYFYPDGTEITDQSLINKIKRAPGYKDEKDRMQREHQQEMLDKVIEYNKTNNDLININQLCPKQIYSEQDFIDKLNSIEIQKYERKEYNEPMPTEEEVKENLLRVATEEIKSVAFWTLKDKRNEYVENNYKELYATRYNYWLKEKEKFEEAESKLEEENNKKYLEEYEKNKSYLKKIIDGDEKSIYENIDSWFNEMELPFECDINYEYNKKKESLFIDLDLPEIENFPNQKAVQLTNGNMKLQDKSQNELYNDYKNYVFGLALFIVGYIFNMSPKIKHITISGYTQRRNKIGDINDEYIYSIKFERDKLSKYDLTSVDSFNTCMNFDNRCNISTNNALRIIEPYNND